MDIFESLNSVLVDLFNDILNIEERALITEEFKDITNTDMHIMEAIGLGEGNNMSSVAKKLNITVGTLTTAINNLVRKKYVERYRSDEDRRVVIIKLTDKGIHAYHHHADYHHQMTQAILDKLTEDEIPVLMKTLDGLTEFFHGYSKQGESKSMPEEEA